MEKLLNFCFYRYLMCRLENRNLDVHLGRIRPVHFPSKDGKNAGTIEREGNPLPPVSAFLPL